MLTYSDSLKVLMMIVRETLVKDLDGLEADGVREEVLRYCQNMFKEEKKKSLLELGGWRSEKKQEPWKRWSYLLSKRERPLNRLK